MPLPAVLPIAKGLFDLWTLYTLGDMAAGTDIGKKITGKASDFIADVKNEFSSERTNKHKQRDAVNKTGKYAPVLAYGGIKLKNRATAMRAMKAMEQHVLLKASQGLPLIDSEIKLIAKNHGYSPKLAKQFVDNAKERYRLELKNVAINSPQKGGTIKKSIAAEKELKRQTTRYKNSSHKLARGLEADLGKFKAGGRKATNLLTASNKQITQFAGHRVPPVINTPPSVPQKIPPVITTPATRIPPVIRGKPIRIPPVIETPPTLSPAQKSVNKILSKNKGVFSKGLPKIKGLDPKRVGDISKILSPLKSKGAVVSKEVVEEVAKKVPNLATRLAKMSLKGKASLAIGIPFAAYSAYRWIFDDDDDAAPVEAPQEKRVTLLDKLLSSGTLAGGSAQPTSKGRVTPDFGSEGLRGMALSELKNLRKAIAKGEADTAASMAEDTFGTRGQ